jgi:sarcosine/dimethylglycine N-methyltransferase
MKPCPAARLFGLMNVADKARLYHEARRVLVTGGRLAIWDLTVGTPGGLGYPLPWADRPELSHLASAGQLHSAVESAGFAVDHWNDLTGEAATLMEAILALPPSPLGLQAIVQDFAEKAKNLTQGLSGGRLRAIQGIARAVA